MTGGGEAPEGIRLDGVDLISHLRGESKKTLAGRVLFGRTGGGQNFAVRQGFMKLVRIGKNPGLWYDLAADIGEANDLAQKRAEAVAALQKELDAWNATLVEPKWPNPTPAKKK